MSQHERTLVYQHKENLNWFMQFRYRYEKRLRHFDKRVVNPDDFTEKAETREDALHFAQMWLRLGKKGEDIHAKYAEMKAELRIVSSRPTTIKSLVDWIKPNASNYWKNPEKYPLPGFAKLVKAYGAKRLSEVGPFFARSYRKELTSEGLSPNTVNRYVEGNAKLWSIAEGEGWVKPGVWTMRDKLAVTKPVKRCMTRAEETTILFKAVELDWLIKRESDLKSAYVAPASEAEVIQLIADKIREGKTLRLYSFAAAALVCMIEGGMRPGEFCLLPLSEVHLFTADRGYAKCGTHQPDEPPHLRIESAKTGKSKTIKVRDVPITARALPLYEALVKFSTNGRLYPFDTFDVALEALCEKAKTARYTPHELRHTAWQRMREQGIQEQIIQQITGSRQSETYGRLDLASALEMLERNLSHESGGKVVEFPSKFKVA